MKTSSAPVGVAVLAAMIELFGFARQALAVPIPWKNCGSATDIVSVQKMNASIWPPVGTPAPLQATAVYDSATGELSSLTIDLLLGPEWVFQTGNLAAPLAGGFVALPSSIPLTLVSPTLPLPAGPTSSTQVLTSSNPGSLPVTIQSNATVGQSITSVNATVGLTYNGTPGFPVPPSAGIYQATLQANESGGQEIFCFTISLPNISFVEAATTLTTLSSALNPSLFGQPITFTATVTSASGTPTGTITFSDGGLSLAVVPVDGTGQAAFSTSALIIGTHPITAAFSGAGAFFSADSTSTTLSQVVNAIPTSITLSSSANPSVAGQAVTFTAAVISSSGTPTGDVNFNDGATLLGTAAVDASGHAVLVSSLAAGTHNLTATFNGSGGFAGSTSTSSVLVQTTIVPTPALDERALLMLAVALAGIGALLLPRS